ncbi:rab-like protein 6 [Patiria miniata]|uniref:Rab-like protein 6 n=1 Tax=Patiria miniata TaxID=46514 RepID=A0A914AJ63_PATMI|nr:rab-like protein 6 [Patiria miniata]
MFNALKKFVTNEQHVGKGSMPTGMQAMGQNLQRRFAKGVQYNMKIIIKGDRNTGKSTLFRRLQGERFKEEYIPTPEIQVGSIQWNYKATDDVVKVEVWDVVDKGKAKKKSDSLKLENSQDLDETDEPCLDARFLNVYKGANGVVFMVDVTKQWTWGYVERELPSVPNHIPVLVLASFRDMADHRTVAEDTMRYFIENYERPPDSATVLLAEASMKNGFGLKYLHTFFNVPFLQLQRETLLRQLETNKLEISATLDELDMRKESIDQNYDLYLTSLEERRKQKKTKATTPTMLSPSVPNGQAPQTSPSPGSKQGSNRTTPVKLSPATTPKQNTPTSTPTTSRKETTPTPEQTKGPKEATPPSDKQGSAATLSQRFSKWFGGGESRVQQGVKEEDEKHAVVETVAEVKTAPISNVDEFVPGEGLGGFLDDVDGPGSKKGKAKKKPVQAAKPTPPAGQSDSEEDDVNPMVAGFQEDLDSDDDVSPFKPTNSIQQAAPVLTSFDVELSSESDQEPAVAPDQDLSDEDLKPAPLSLRHLQQSANQDKGLSVFSNSIVGKDSTDSAKSKNNKTKSRGSDTESSLSHEQLARTDSGSDNEQSREHVSRTSSQTTDQDTSPASPMIQLQQEDFNFLESVGSTKKPGLTKRPSLPADDFDNLLSVTKDEDISDTDTMTSTSTSSSAVKKKKHKSKDKDRDEEKGSRKHRHKKHREKNRDHDRHSDKHGDRHGEKESHGEDKGEGKKKKRSSSVRKEEEEGSTKTKTEYDALEAFLEGPGYEVL